MKLDRMMGILTLLLQRKHVTAPYLAERFEVTRRTISRDIDALCMAGIPIVTRRGSGGGISIAEGYALDKNVFTQSELSDIVTALKGMGSVAWHQEITTTLEKLLPGGTSEVPLREPVIIDLSSYFSASLTNKTELIKHAALERQVVEFEYHYTKGVSHRRVDPYLLIFQWSAWYMFGYCHIRHDWRMFKLARIQELRLTSETYEEREIPPDKREFGNLFEDIKRLVAIFETSVRYRLTESYGPDSYTIMPDGSLLLDIYYTDDPYIVEWLMGFGDKARVLEPASVITAIKGIIGSMAKMYDTPGK